MPSTPTRRQADIQRERMDRLFKLFVIGIFTVLVLYGAGMTAVILWGDPLIASRMVSGFGTMFAGVLGLGSGYLLGRNK